MLISYLRTDHDGIEKLRLGYTLKVNLLRTARLIPEPLADILRKLNKLRQKLAHELTYTLTNEDMSQLMKDAPKEIAVLPQGESRLQALAPFLAGMLSGGVGLARLFQDAINKVKNPLDQS